MILPTNAVIARAKVVSYLVNELQPVCRRRKTYLRPGPRHSMKTDLLALQAERRILLLRSLRVMFDYDLAELYGVETKALNRAVKRNVERFPDDFMFQLTEEEWDNLKCQVGTSSSTALEPPAAASTWGGRRRSLPYAFTEQGVAMLSSVLRSPRAVQVNIAIMRTFVRLREMLLTNADLARKLADLERKYDFQFKAVFDAIRQLMAPPPPQPPRPEIGFHVKEDAVPYRTRRKPRPLVHHS